MIHDAPRPVAPARVVVLGASGVIGSVLVALLRGKGIPVLALGSRDLNLVDDATAAKLEQMLRPDDAIVVLAGLTPDRGRDLETMVRNIDMATVICAALDRRPVAHVVYMSSDAVYPRRVELVNEGSAIEPNEPYAAMHVVRERQFAALIRAPLAILRVTQVSALHDTHDAYGPNRFRRTAAAEGRIALFGGGEETRDHIMVEDVARLLYLCLAHRSRGVLNVATGRSPSFAEVASIVAAGFDPAPAIVSVPRKVPITHRRFDISALRRAFPDFAFTPLEDGEARIQAALRSCAAETMVRSARG
jgi:nucleoside-diphosphate-sugar epimerase